MVVCIKHWLSNYQTYSKKAHQIPVDPPSNFFVPRSSTPQTRSAPRKVKDCKIDRESRTLATQKNRAS